MQGAWGIGGRPGIRAAKVAFGALCTWAATVAVATAAPPTIEGTTVSGVTSTSATLEAKINPQSKASRYHFEYGLADCSTNPCTSIPLPEGELAAGSSPVVVKVTVEGLAPATIYHLRAVAKNGEASNGPDRVFATYATLFEGLPDSRAYEQASPVNKNGGDAVGQQSLVKAAADGSGISFGSTFGIPGGKGAQGFTSYLASRGSSIWSTQGLLPPPSVGERDKVLGWLPDYSEAFTEAIKLGNPRTEGLVVQSTKTQALRLIGPYRSKAEYAYAGASKGAPTVLLEAKVALPPKEGDPQIPAAKEGFSNVYAWDRPSGELHLASVLNDETSPAKGAFAGPYDWSLGSSANRLREGGAARSYYLQDTRAITADGSVYFTAAGSGQLYLRKNPTKAQSPLNGEGKCTDPTLACTYHASAAKKTNGQGEGGTDPVGEQPAVFQTASADGSEVFFTSPEKLTNDANTGPEQPKAAIGRGGIGGGIEDEQFIPKRAVGVAVDGSHVYWADPAGGTIGRANLDGSNPDPAFIVVPPGECEVHIEIAPGKFIEGKVSIPTTPRYVAVDAGHVYWTNSGLLGQLELPADGGGTIGRADINGSEASIEPNFICGASNPQGIAVNATHIYWANAALDPVSRSIARAAIGGGAVEENFFKTNADIPYGVALSPTHVYFDRTEEGNQLGFIARVPLGGGTGEIRFVGQSGLRGIAVDASHVYWATQGEGGTIGRADLELENRENKFTIPAGKLNGLAADGAHLYWGSNGESAGNPGNDLYRYQPEGEALSDLTPLAGGNGAEVQGVLGASADGSYLYFAANGVLAAGASQGNCKGPVRSTKGKCNLYLLHEGQISFVAPMNAENDTGSDALNWVATPREVFASGSYVPKTAFLSADGKTLLFRSQDQLTAYDNEGVPEFYRYEAGNPEISCLSCRPSGEAVEGGPKLTQVVFPSLQPEDSVMGVQSRNLSVDGKHFFFETSEALSPEDTNGQAGCPFSGTASQNFPSCTDVYEWEAPGSGTCKEAAPSYSPLNGGCVYLISTGKSKYPSLFADASESGEDVFFFTRQSLVGQDKDELQDVYDARVGGGLASQNPTTPVPCEGTEACHGPAQPPPVESTPATPGFVGPGNKVEKHKKQKQKKAKKKHKGKGHKKNAKKHKANSKGRAGR